MARKLLGLKIDDLLLWAGSDIDQIAWQRSRPSGLEIENMLAEMPPQCTLNSRKWLLPLPVSPLVPSLYLQQCLHCLLAPNHRKFL